MSKLKEIKLRWSMHVPEDQVSKEFLQGMLDHMIVGFHNYGHTHRTHNKADSIKCLCLRLKKYRETHNTEFLMDAANFCMMEFMVPKDPRAFYAPTTKKESPGAILQDGRRVMGKEEM
jgi:hypothetical protein